MDKTTILGNIIVDMREYQKINNIENQCITNVSFIYDIYKNSFKNTNNVKVKAVIVIAGDKNYKTCSIIVRGHLVLLINDDYYIDPSYDVFCLENKIYIDNVKEFLDLFDEKSRQKLNVKEIISTHIKFIKYETRINDGEFLIADKTHYNKQADYICNLYSQLQLYSQQIKEL